MERKTAGHTDRKLLNMHQKAEIHNLQSHQKAEKTALHQHERVEKEAIKPRHGK